MLFVFVGGLSDALHAEVDPMRKATPIVCIRIAQPRVPVLTFLEVPVVKEEYTRISGALENGGAFK